MSGWHCHRWAENLTEPFPNITFEDGDDCDDIYGEARCGSFIRSGSFISDEHDNLIDSDMDRDSDAWCNEHDREAEWEATFSSADDLIAAGFYVCADDDQTFHTEEALTEHNANEHDENEYNEDAVFTPNRIPVRTYSGVQSSHSNWIS